MLHELAHRTPIGDSMSKLPTKFKGTVKLHGSNAGVCFNETSGLWCQSRSQIIEAGVNDNAGFALFIENRSGVVLKLIRAIAKGQSIDLTLNTVSLFGEWAGNGIQSGVGISKVDKAFFIFGFKVSQTDGSSYWVDTEISNPGERIFNINNFPTFEVMVDLDNPQVAQQTFVEITNAVELECPVAKHLGVHEGTGEGVVWSTTQQDEVYRFKVKGIKHSVTKVKTLAPVDMEKLNSIQEFVEYVSTENRVDQGIKEVFGESPVSKDKTGVLLRWFINDVMSEELDTLEANGLTPKLVNAAISKKVRGMFFEKVEAV